MPEDPAAPCDTADLPHVLVAEDNPVNQSLAKAFLTRAGLPFTIVSDGQQAVDAVLGGGVDVVLMDCQMPVMDGFEATAGIRELDRQGRLASMPRIVALTANAMQGDREKCLAAGMDDFVGKPIDEDDLIAKVRGALDAPAHAAHAVAAEPAAPPAIDGKALLARCMNMAELAQQILQIFEQSCRGDLDHLAQAVGSGDLPGVASYAHKIKGAAAQVAADPLCSLAEQLEKAGQRGEAEQTPRLLKGLREEMDRCLTDAPRVIEGLPC